jgi:hypothetical protein
MVPSHRGEDKDDVPRPDDRLGCILQLIGNRTMFELLHCPQHRIIKCRQIDPADGVSRLFRVGKTAAEPVRGRVGMADHNQDASRHGLLPGRLALPRQGRSTLATW